MAQMMLANQEISHKLSCKCGDGSLTLKSNQRSIGDDLYFCKHCTSDEDSTCIYCEDCGIFYHRRNKRGHRFDVGTAQNVWVIKDLVEMKEDDHHFSRAKDLIVKIIGIERYNKIAPALTVATPVLGGGVMGATLYYELNKHFSTIAKTSKLFKNFKPANVAKFGTYAVIAASIVEMGINAYRWQTGQISGKEWCRLSGKTVVRNAVAFGGAAGGAKLGAVIGTATCPVVGTVCGIVLGVLFGALMGKAAELLYDHYLPDEEETARRQAVREALQYFHFKKEDIDNRRKFNEKELKKRFKEFALIHHPDRTGGSCMEWCTLSTHYGILKGLLEERSVEIKKKIAKRALAITAN